MQVGLESHVLAIWDRTSAGSALALVLFGRRQEFSAEECHFIYVVYFFFLLFGFWFSGRFSMRYWKKVGRGGAPMGEYLTLARVVSLVTSWVMEV